MTSPLCQAPAIRPEEGVDFQISFVLLFLFSLLLKQQELQKPSCQTSAATKHGCSYTKDDDDGHYHRPDKSDSVFATFSAPKTKRGNRTQKLGIAPAEYEFIQCMNSYEDYEFTQCMNSHDKYEFTQYMNSHEECEFMQCVNSHDDMNSSEYMTSHNDMNSSDYMNSHAPLCVFVPDSR